MKIAQITDIHIGPDSSPVKDVDVRRNFMELLMLAKSYGYDALLLTGDLCFQNPIPATYDWIREVIAEGVEAPYYVIPGNHDDSVLLANRFNLSDKLHEQELYYTCDVAGKTLICLDSGIGKISPAQKDWLKETLKSLHRKPLLLFMHHPPIHGLVPHMDLGYALQDREEIMEILQASDKLVHVFCGHYHVDKIIQQGKVTVHITPSGFIQIDQRQEAFNIDHLQPGFRMIELMDDRLYSQVHYVR